MALSFSKGLCQLGHDVKMLAEATHYGETA